MAVVGTTQEEYRNITVFLGCIEHIHSCIAILCAVNAWALNTMAFCFVPI